MVDNDAAADCDDDDDDDDDDSDADADDQDGKYNHHNKRGNNKKRKKKKRSAPKKKNGSVIYSGVNSELARRAFLNNHHDHHLDRESDADKQTTVAAASAKQQQLTEIEDHEEIVLSGQWECQIISQLLMNHDTNNGGNQKKLGAAQKIMMIGGGEAQKKRGTTMTILTTAAKSKNNPLLLMNKQQRGNNTNHTTTLTGGRSVGLASRGGVDSGFPKKKSKLLPGGVGGFFKPPAAAVAASSNNNVAATAAASGKRMKKKDTNHNGEWYLDKKSTDEDDEVDDDMTSAATTLSRKINIPSSLVRGASSSLSTTAASTLGTGLMMRKRPLGSSGGIGGGLMKRGSSTAQLPRTTMMTSRAKSSSNTTSSAMMSSSSSSTNFFPGALGDKINIPNSIRQILRPHQREGIAFLWNCVTGVSLGLNNAIVRAQQQAATAANSCSSSLSSMGSFDLEDEEMDDNSDDVDYDDCGVASLQGGGGGAKKKKTIKGEDNVMPRGAVLADEMGLGKTLMTIATIFALHRTLRDRRFIVVCPSSLVSNWAKEFDKWIGKASQPKRVIVRNGNEEGLRKLRSFVPLKPNQSEVLILSYELFRLHVKVICNATKIGLLVVDEGHRLKNTAGSQTLSALNSISAEARILISGTVIQNNLSEFYNLASFAVPGILGDLNTFRRLYERPMSCANQKNASLDQKEKGRQQSKLLDSITSTFVLRRTQKDVLKSILPPRKEILLFCRPTERQCQLYKSISNRASKSIESIGGIEASTNPLMLLTEARKLCTHPSLLEEAGNSSLELSGKMIILSSLLDSIRQNNPTDKVVIISNFTSALTVVEDSILLKKNLPFVRLDGSTDNALRGPLVDSFNNRSIKHSFAFMLSSKAGGCGLNLIGANRLIMVDADWNPATDQQAMARIYRQGQTKPCFIYRLFTTGTVEEVIFQRQTQKGNLAKIANDGGSKKASSTNASFTNEELRDCFTLKEGCKCDTKKKLGNQWSDYNGADSLRNHGCVDEPLLGVCEDEAGTLSFVHLVDDDEINPVDLDDDAKEKEEASDVDDDSSLGLGSESSSEEEEFDG